MSEFERFWKKVDASGGLDACYGYGAGGARGAHRVACEMIRGPVGLGHPCHNATCQVPASECPHRGYLEPVTQRENLLREGTR